MNSLQRNPPVGEMKKIVSLVDRSDFDEVAYPADEKSTIFQSNYQPYHNFTTEVVTYGFTGSPEWGKRITFSVPWPWTGDMLSWVILRLKPLPWMNPSYMAHLLPQIQGDWTLVQDPPEYNNYNEFFVWANSLGTTAIALVEMEVDGVILEQFSGDWIDIWNRTYHSVSAAVPWDDSLYGRQSRYKSPTINNLLPTEDGFIYCYLPFWFSKFNNTAFPLCSTRGPDTVRFHITLRPFNEVVRRIAQPMVCGDSPLGKTFLVQDTSENFIDIQMNTGVPGFESADILAGIVHLDTQYRDAYINKPHEIMMNPVTEIVFSEPLKYLVNRNLSGQDIQINLPLEVNGPLRQIYFIIRRKAAIEQYNDRQNYSATIQPDSVWNPEKPLLRRAVLQVGTAIWVDQEEMWWRTQSNLPLPGGVRGYGDFIYAYNFADKPAEFAPSGSLNASRTDIRLQLHVIPPNDEWTVSVFVVNINWIRFEKSIANLVFSD